MKKKYLYILTVNDDETGEEIGSVEAYSGDSIVEQFREVDTMIQRHEAKQHEFNGEELSGE